MPKIGENGLEVQLVQYSVVLRVGLLTTTWVAVQQLGHGGLFGEAGTAAEGAAGGQLELLVTLTAREEHQGLEGTAVLLREGNVDEGVEGGGEQGQPLNGEEEHIRREQSDRGSQRKLIRIGDRRGEDQTDQ